MKMSRLSEPQILTILRQAEGGVPGPELCHEHGMSTASFYKWRAKYGSTSVDLLAEKQKATARNKCSAASLYFYVHRRTTKTNHNGSRAPSGYWLQKLKGEDLSTLPSRQVP